MSVPVSSFFRTVTNCFFFFSILFISLISFSFFITLQLPLFSLQKLPSSLFSSHHLILSYSFKTPSFSHFLSRLSSSPSTAPKAKKTSYVLSSYAFLLTHWSEVVRLTESPSLTHRLENHIPMAESISFSNFSHFQVSLWSSILMCFGPCKCLGFVVGWV